MKFQHLCRRNTVNVQSRYFSSSFKRDKKRMRIVEMGGAEELVNMLVGVKDDKIKKQALKALAAILKSDGAVAAVAAVAALQKGGALPVIKSTPDSDEFKAIEEYKSKLLARFRFEI